MVRIIRYIVKGNLRATESQIRLASVPSPARRNNGTDSERHLFNSTELAFLNFGEFTKASLQVDRTTSDAESQILLSPLELGDE